MILPAAITLALALTASAPAQESSIAQVSPPPPIVPYETSDDTIAAMLGIVELLSSKTPQDPNSVFLPGLMIGPANRAEIEARLSRLAVTNTEILVSALRTFENMRQSATSVTSKLARAMYVTAALTVLSRKSVDDSLTSSLPDYGGFQTLLYRDLLTRDQGRVKLLDKELRETESELFFSSRQKLTFGPIERST